jgi:hypothetical protein
MRIQATSILTFWAISYAFVAGSIALAQPTSRPMSEMHGKCSDFAWDVQNELKLWGDTPVALTAAPLAAKASEAPKGKKIQLELGSERLMRLLVQPARPTPPEMSSFGGFVAFEVPRDGDYRVSAGSRLWFEVVPAGKSKAVESPGFEMQTGCEKIIKVVLYPLKAKTRYLLQVTGSAVSNAAFLITPAPAN